MQTQPVPEVSADTWSVGSVSSQTVMQTLHMTKHKAAIYLNYFMASRQLVLQMTLSVLTMSEEVRSRLLLRVGFAIPTACWPYKHFR